MNETTLERLYRSIGAWQEEAGGPWWMGERAEKAPQTPPVPLPYTTTTPTEASQP